jgi:predicted nuclease of predicted toxin-antitoxin system
LIKLLADENVPLEAVKTIRRKSVDIVSVIEFSLGLSDMEVLDLANREGRIIVTFDKDFGELVIREKMKVKGLILLRFTPKSPQQIAEKVWRVLTSGIPVENNLLIVREHTVSYSTTEVGSFQRLE